MRRFDTSNITIHQAIAELKRELEMRNTVYPRQIAAGNLNKIRANHQYKCLQKLLDIFEPAEAEVITKNPHKQGKLF